VPLPISALNNKSFEKLYKLSHFNPIQTQVFHVLYHTDQNVLLGAPTGSGKTIAAEIAMLKVFRDTPHLKVVYIGPLKALVRERLNDWEKKFGEGLGKKVIELTGDYTPNIRALQTADIVLTTPGMLHLCLQTLTHYKKNGMVSAEAGSTEAM
jgi:activating signal cointegrator complex subunit 3